VLIRHRYHTNSVWALGSAKKKFPSRVISLAFRRMGLLFLASRQYQSCLQFLSHPGNRSQVSIPVFRGKGVRNAFSGFDSTSGSDVEIQCGHWEESVGLVLSMESVPFGDSYSLCGSCLICFFSLRCDDRRCMHSTLALGSVRENGLIQEIGRTWTFMFSV
jgi:hypothetical protein